jgi:hypothetical protein
MFGTMLLAVDGSPSAVHAVEFARRLAGDGRTSSRPPASMTPV